MPNNSLVNIEGKALEKLIGVTAQGVGTLYRPRAIRNEADAKAYEIRVIGRAETEVMAERNELLAESDIRIQERWLYQERNRQRNIDNVVQNAIEQYNPETTVSDEPVNEDWSTRFFNIVQDVSEEEMQLLWAKILAGEVKQPKSYSLRTLELLRNLSKEEADVLNLAGNFVINFQNTPLIFKQKYNDFWTKYGLTLSHQLLLTELGIIQPEPDLKFVLRQSPANSQFLFTSGKYIIRVKKTANTKERDIPIIKFTKVGGELLKLLTPDVNEEYFKEFVANFDKNDMDIDYAFIIERKVSGVIHSQPWRKFE